MPGANRPSRTRHGGRHRHGEGSRPWMVEMRKLPCHYCAGPGGTVDLVIPRSKGGRPVKENAVPACASCNNFRKSKDYEEFKRVGWKRRMFA